VKSSRRDDRGIAFLTSQVGALSSKLWNQAVEEIGIDSRTAMLLWNVSIAEGRSQRELAAVLRLPASRIVDMVDAMEERGWIVRRIRAGDRRTRELHLTPAGRKAVNRVMAAGAAHERRFTTGLAPAEKTELERLLGKLSVARGLSSTSHPDF
jgi:MarR family transcriptional regulator for hemolysin